HSHTPPRVRPTRLQLQVLLRDVPCQSGDDATRDGAPVRREQAGERRYEVAAAVVLDLGGQLVDLRRAGDDAEVVAQPLHQRAGDRDRSLQRVHRLVLADAVAEGGQQAALARYRGAAGVEQQERTGAVGALRLPGIEAGLPEQ